MYHHVHEHSIMKFNVKLAMRSIYNYWCLLFWLLGHSVFMLVRIFLLLMILVAVMLALIRRLFTLFSKGQFFVFGILFGWCAAQLLGVVQPW
jgi:hypothetical protein